MPLNNLPLSKILNLKPSYKKEITPALSNNYYEKDHK